MALSKHPFFQNLDLKLLSPKTLKKSSIVLFPVCGVAVKQSEVHRVTAQQIRAEEGSRMEQEDRGGRARKEK